MDKTLTNNYETRLTVGSNGEAVNLFGHQDENLKFIESHTSARIVARGNELTLSGTRQEVEELERLFRQLIKLAHSGMTINTAIINYTWNLVRHQNDMAGQTDLAQALGEVLYVTPRGKQIRPKTLGQLRYVQAMRRYDIVFGIGPAGTGKTYLAVVMAVNALRSRSVERIILARPAVEAGEKLGFLPGDLQEKVNPYLRPLYDGLYDILGMETAQKYMEKNIIEVAPLAYMRGRTLDDAFIILDEAQNTTSEQMKMFLTRIGFGSRAVITGDVTQVDLPRDTTSGLVEAQQILRGIEGIAIEYLTEADVVRHPLVQEIIKAYERSDRMCHGSG
ncbi:MAG: phosphate starvation-inducible protein PhoH [Moorella sp. (in: firmicutes)]|jgi:phosphate starvation-inducible PhoH-like protein|uniref:PhoH family protein n=1 Tax=unclassified Neomoorella TaxID=2676739 RepID=UPI0010FFAF06|nr:MULTISPECIES: PhoH family protein [unclassified Moorella (in: firmicutes)]MDK2815807.1 phosphate starvation-inducible protein PhoH [Moorella sp. (in: firmicutes)]MDK2895740.1 phosphate starvation-inducible protein PhoH [Moorella sp. (in: firmicutes)]GEA16479.1 phosphate starvation protein PhoH [Moorella sp. E308F]GEA17342.1 phosphate starvation protein PhoH [Moorella sp. E306M]